MRDRLTIKDALVEADIPPERHSGYLTDQS
jgi:hypothetical protein